MKPSTATLLRVGHHAVAAAESLLWPSRSRELTPLIEQFSDVMAERFRSQRAFVLRKITPYAILQTEAQKPGDKAELFDGWEDSQPRINTMDRLITLTVEAGAGSVVRDANVSISFKPRTDSVIGDYLSQRAAAKIGADVDATTKKRLHDVLVRGYEERWSRAKLTKTIKGMFDGFAKRTPYSFIGSRAEAIAVTELGQSYSHGALEAAFRAERENGIILEKGWALAATPCPICAPNGSQGFIPLDKPFSSGHMRPLAHPVCRCSLLTRVKPG